MGSTRARKRLRSKCVRHSVLVACYGQEPKRMKHKKFMR